MRNRSQSIIFTLAASVTVLWHIDVAGATFLGNLALSWGDTTCYNAGVAETSPITISSSCSGSKPHGNGTLDYSGSFAARADYTGLGVYAEWSQEINAPDTTGTTGSVSAGAQINDSLLILNGSGSGTLMLPIFVSGTDSAFGGAHSYGALWTSGPGQFVLDSGTAFYVEGPGLYTLELPFSFGVPVPLNLFMTSTIWGLGNSDGDFSGGTSDYFSSADFLPFIVFDSNQLLLPNATVFSTSGFQYSVADATPVPVPSALVLLASGLLGLGVYRRREVSA